MIAFFGNWLRALIAGAFLAAFILAMAPEGKSQSALRFLTGVWMTLLLLQPLRNVKSKLRAELPDWEQLRISEIENTANAQAEKIYSSFIRRETEEYIWNAAGELGIETLGVSLTLNTDAACPYPWEVSLRGEYSEAQREALSLLLKSELGISPERQHWSRTDADRPEGTSAR